jgi:TetR/AcrR family transcriptional regulator, transcriptional repressor for nem operon
MPRPAKAREKLLTEAIGVIRRKGYAATSVEELCTAAGVTKGAFFHHFPSKEALATAAAEKWHTDTGAMFACAEYHDAADPLDRLLGYLRLRRALLDGPLPEITCYLGTTVQEAYESSPAIRDSAHAGISAHAATLRDDIAGAIAAHPPRRAVDPDSLALHTQAVIQGAFVIAKAADDIAPARASLDHLIDYVELLFGRDAD